MICDVGSMPIGHTSAACAKNSVRCECQHRARVQRYSVLFLRLGPFPHAMVKGEYKPPPSSYLVDYSSVEASQNPAYHFRSTLPPEILFLPYFSKIIIFSHLRPLQNAYIHLFCHFPRFHRNVVHFLQYQNVCFSFLPLLLFRQRRP